MRLSLAVVAFGSTLVLAGCNGSDGGRNAGRSTHGCSGLTAADIAQLTGEMPQKRDLNPPEGSGIRCSTVFAGAGGSLVLAVTEWDGDAKTLHRVRSTYVTRLGTGSVQSVPGLGQGAFVVRKRVLGFRRGATVTILETGYDSSGRRVLTLAQLKRLAQP
jgi:hypothetical protein